MSQTQSAQPATIVGAATIQLTQPITTAAGTKVEAITMRRAKVKDLRRMNVAMTRARMKLIILGNKDTMTKHPFYKKLWEYVEAINNNE